MYETILKPVHERLGARLVPFAGWLMPVQYRDILDEARLVRSKAGLFDLGHMGRISISGADAEAFLQRVQTNDAAKIPPGAIRYSMFLDCFGRTQDDILVYRNPENDGFFLVVNASNTDRDKEILRRTAGEFSRLKIEDRTAELGMFAIQGPASERVTQKICDVDLKKLKYYSWTRAKVGGSAISVSRTGYTGEDGFEFYAPQDQIVRLWDMVLSAGRDEGVLPCGLGSRDTLRHEAGMPLYGHEIDAGTDPLEAGLGWAVKFTHDFTGRAALERSQAAGGSGRRLVGMTTDSRRCPRQGYTLHDPKTGREIGKVCSGSVSPTLGKNIATGYVLDAHAIPGSTIEFSVRDKREPAIVCDLPFYKRSR